MFSRGVPSSTPTPPRVVPAAAAATSVRGRGGRGCAAYAKGEGSVAECCGGQPPSAALLRAVLSCRTLVFHRHSPAPRAPCPTSVFHRRARRHAPQAAAGNVPAHNNTLTRVHSTCQPLRKSRNGFRIAPLSVMKRDRKCFADMLTPPDIRVHPDETTYVILQF